jgi:metallo-beta-lactamase class B
LTPARSHNLTGGAASPRQFRFWRWLLLLVLSAVSLTGPGRAVAGDSGTHKLAPDLRVEAVAPGIWRHESVKIMPEYGAIPANGLIVIGNDAAALIDTPWTDEQTALLFDYVEREFGVKVAHVVATHSHGDCMGGLAQAHELGAESHALELTAEFARSDGNPVPRQTFTEKSRISLGDMDVELRYFGGGHTRDNIVAWIPRQKVLFGGCLVKREGASPGYTAEADLAAWPETIREIMAALPEAEIVVPGHGSPGTLAYLEYTIELVRELDQ